MPPARKIENRKPDLLDALPCRPWCFIMVPCTTPTIARRVVEGHALALLQAMLRLDGVREPPAHRRGLVLKPLPNLDAWCSNPRHVREPHQPDVRRLVLGVVQVVAERVIGVRDAKRQFLRRRLDAVLRRVLPPSSALIGACASCACTRMCGSLRILSDADDGVGGRPERGSRLFSGVTGGDATPRSRTLAARTLCTMSQRCIWCSSWTSRVYFFTMASRSSGSWTPLALYLSMRAGASGTFSGLCLA